MEGLVLPFFATFARDCSFRRVLGWLGFSPYSPGFWRNLGLRAVGSCRTQPCDGRGQRRGSGQGPFETRHVQFVVLIVQKGFRRNAMNCPSFSFSTNKSNPFWHEPPGNWRVALGWYSTNLAAKDVVWFLRQASCAQNPIGHVSRWL